MIESETRGGAGRWRAVGLIAAVLVASGATSPAQVFAQGEVRADDRSRVADVRAADIRVASDEERYLRALSVLAPQDAVDSWTIRPVDGERMIRTLATLDGPWRLDTRQASDGLRFRGADVDVAVNSGLPSFTPDGPAWSGRGTNLRASGTVTAKRGRLRVRIAPMFWVAQNASYDLVPTSGPFPWSDAAVPRTIDIPQRFGDGATARVDAGESSIELRWKYTRLALTSAAAQLGPGSDHSLIMQGNAGGFPRMELGTPGGLRTRAGTFAAQVAWGRTPHTAWAPDRRTGALFSSYLMGTWRPSFVDRLELGMVRLTHRDWEKITAKELFVPFGSIYSTPLVGGDYDTGSDNQLASLFAQLRVPEAGLEFFAEFGKNDRSTDWRDQAMELEHNSAWLFGVQKVWRDGARRLWALNLTTVSGSIAPITRFRGQAYFYEHGIMTQGHTLRGQLLGTPLLQREGGGELRLDRYDARGRVGLLLGTRSLPNELAESISSENVRQEWTAMLDMLRWTRAGAWRARLGGVADLGHSPLTGDAYSLHLSLGYSRRR